MTSSEEPACVLTYQLGSRTIPLNVIRASRFRIRRQRGRSAGPVGRHVACAVVAEDGTNYMTACGAIVRIGSRSIWDTTTCKECRRALEKRTTDG